jgi:hypothetical protein
MMTARNRVLLCPGLPNTARVGWACLFGNESVSAFVFIKGIILGFCVVKLAVLVRKPHSDIWIIRL